MSMALTQLLRKAAQEAPQRAALRQDARMWTFAQLQDGAARLASDLRALGVCDGQRVGMLAPNGIHYAAFMWGTWWAGGVINPVNVRWSAAEVAYSLDDSDTQILLVDDPFVALAEQARSLSQSLRHLVYCGPGEAPATWLRLSWDDDGNSHREHDPWVEGVPPTTPEADTRSDGWAQRLPMADVERSGDQLAMIMYTGGTTGKPKGVMLSHTNLYVATLGSMAMAPRPMYGTALVVAPMFHIAALGTSLRMLRNQSQQVFLQGFDEAAVLEAIAQHRITDMFLVPTMIRRLIEHPDFKQHDTSSMRSITYGAAAIDPTLLERAMAAFPQAQFCQAFGMTELSPTITMLTPEQHLPGPKRNQRLRSAGQPLPIAEVRVVNADEQVCGVGEVGEICARGPMVMMGYWKQPELTAQALRGGWMHTGDLGYFDADGFLTVVDRLKDMVITGGENVYSAEVERVVTQLAQVSQCAIIGVPDPRWGERVHAVIVPREGHTVSLADIDAHCRQHLAAYKCPRSLELRDALPLSAAGKVLKNVLRAPHWQHQASGVA